MRIESWGRFSVYVARIRNFVGPIPHPIPRRALLSAHTYACAARARAREPSLPEGKNGIRIFDLQFRGLVVSRRARMYQTRDATGAFLTGIKNAVPRGEPEEIKRGRGRAIR